MLLCGAVRRLMRDGSPEEGENEHDQGGDEHRFQRDCPPLGAGGIGRERGEQHGRIDRTDDREEGGKSGESGFEHWGREAADQELGWQDRCPFERHRHKMVGQL